MMMISDRYLPIADIVGRVCLCLFFGLALLRRITFLPKAWSAPDVVESTLRVASEGASILFLALVCAAVITRLPPIKSADGIEPWLTAIVGTVLLGFVSYFPPAEIPLWLRLVSFVLIAAGLLLSAYVVLWLGRSISVVPEARRLVTGGPYSAVRHPLYLTEEMAVIGTILLNLSTGAVLLGIVHWCLQLRRMVNEERVLRSAFPEYDDYAARVPRIVPRLQLLGNAAVGTVKPASEA